jgi:tRNA 2-thiocytidine biosynthesis protein TtcA
MPWREDRSLGSITPAERLAYWLLKDVNKAIRAYDMIRDGDRVLVALSGGKDSFSLLRLLDLRRRMVPERYELMAVHVQADTRGPDTPAHPPLTAWLQANGYHHAIEPLLLPPEEPLPLDCQRCTWNRRHTLFEAAQRHACNVVAYGHHADDLAQTTLLNLLFHGRVETMLPHRDYFDGALRLIRPLCLVAEQELRRYATVCELPAPPPECPRGAHSQRRLVADMLRDAQRQYRNVRTNLLRAGLKYAGVDPAASDP